MVLTSRRLVTHLRRMGEVEEGGNSVAPWMVDRPSTGSQPATTKEGQSGRVAEHYTIKDDCPRNRLSPSRMREGIERLFVTFDPYGTLSPSPDIEPHPDTQAR